MSGRVGIRVGLLMALSFACAIATPQGTLQKNRPTTKDDEISIAYEFVWGGPQSFGSFAPVRVEIENPLRDDSGFVIVSSGTYRVRYPVELPSRSLRSFIVYVPTSQSYSEATIELDCRQVYLKATVESISASSPSVFDFGLISDSPSLITFLRTLQTVPENAGRDAGEVKTYRDFVALPSKAPDRSIGYNGLDMLVLSEGAERLTDAEVSAIQRYVLAGGTLLMTGGAVSPILRDERWAAFVPGTNPMVVNVPGSTVVSSVTGVPLRQEMSVTKITPAPGTTGLSENGIPMLWYRKCGMGMVVYWAFDPFQSPVRTYPGRAKLFTDTVATISAAPDEYKTEIGVALQAFGNDYYGGYAGMSGYPGYYPEETTDSVFRVSMPPTGTVFLILACYFVVVVPLNFLILGKLGKGQLAWVTSPVIGLAFAGVFFYVARDLYGASLSRSTRALVVAHEGSPSAYAVGNQQLFFPVGGRYDLMLNGVESLTTTSDFVGDMYGGMGRDTGFSDALVDVGQVVATNAGVSNLAFREIHFEQAVDWQHRLPLRLQLEGPANLMRAQGAFTNDTPYDLSSTTVWVGLSQVVLGEVKSGETRSINEFLSAPSQSVQTYGQRGYEQPPVSAGQVALTADVQGLTVGSTVGKEQGRGTRLFFTYSSVSGSVGK